MNKVYMKGVEFMSSSIYSNSGQKSYGITNYIVDNPEDIAKEVPKKCKPGCMVYVINNSTYYMMNHKQQWKKMNIVNGSNNTSSSNDDFDPFNLDGQNVTYDGLDLDNP